MCKLIASALGLIPRRENNHRGNGLQAPSHNKRKPNPPTAKVKTSSKSGREQRPSNNRPGTPHKRYAQVEQARLLSPGVVDPRYAGNQANDCRRVAHLDSVDGKRGGE